MPRSNRLENSEAPEPQESSDIKTSTSETVVPAGSDESKTRRPRSGRSTGAIKKSSGELSSKKSPSSSRNPSRSNSSSTRPRPKGSTRTSIADENSIESVSTPSGQIPRMLQLYRSSVKDALMAEFEYQNVMELPMIKKVVINIKIQLIGKQMSIEHQKELKV